MFILQFLLMVCSGLLLGDASFSVLLASILQKRSAQRVTLGKGVPCTCRWKLSAPMGMLGNEGYGRAPTASATPGLKARLTWQGLTCSSLITDLVSMYHITAIGIKHETRQTCSLPLLFLQSSREDI